MWWMICYLGKPKVTSRFIPPRVSLFMTFDEAVEDAVEDANHIRRHLGEKTVTWAYLKSIGWSIENAEVKHKGREA